MEEPKDRLKLARERAGYESASDAARALGIRGSTYAAHENGQNKLKPPVADRYARAFRVRTEWLLYGRGAMELEEKPAAKAATQVPITGIAGHDRNGTILPTEGRTVAVELPIDLTQRWEAIEVEGLLLEPFFRQNSFLLYRPVLVRDLSLLEGHECVIELLDGRRLLKRPMPDDENPGQWLLESDLVLPMENQEIRSASPIRLIQIWNAHSRIAA